MFDVVIVPEKVMIMGHRKITIPEFEITPIYIRESVCTELNYDPERYKPSSNSTEDRPLIVYDSRVVHTTLDVINQFETDKDVQWVLPSESQIMAFSDSCPSDNLEDDLQYLQIVADVSVSLSRANEYRPADGSPITQELLREEGWGSEMQPLGMVMRNNMEGRHYRRVPICVAVGWDVYGFRLVKQYSAKVKYGDVCEYLGIA